MKFFFEQSPLFLEKFFIFLFIFVFRSSLLCFSNTYIRVLLATIRDKGLFPCVRCMVPKSSLDRLATHKDMKYREKVREFQEERVRLARVLINEKGKGVASSAVETLLQEFSAVPTMVCVLFRLLHAFAFVENCHCPL